MDRRPGLPSVDVVVPVRNEDRSLEQSIRTLHAALERIDSFAGRIIIADNGSSDGTNHIAHALSRELPHVMTLRLDLPGRGRALRAAWSSSTADVVAYMDVDLSTDLGSLPRLIHVITSGAADVAVGSRLMTASRVRRSLRRELISRSYNQLLRRLLKLGVRDAQCGFKALRADVPAPATGGARQQLVLRHRAPGGG